VIHVVDASTVVSALLDDGEEGRWCEEHLQVDQLAAPHLMPFEAINVVRRTEAKGAVSASVATNALHVLTQLPVALLPFDSVADRVWELRANLSAYDAAYVAVAELLGGRLVTLDRKMSRAPGIRCPVAVP
jgi:predicted nucleic acid-binding protein